MLYNFLINYEEIIMSQQVEMISLDELVPAKHQYRKFIKIFDFNNVNHHLKSVEKDANYKGYGVDRLFKCLLLQFMEDLSDRELERMLQENNSAKWFCDFTLSERTPNFSVFSRIRSKIGTNKLSKIFSLLRNQLRNKGFMSEVFTFVDASHLVSKAALWQERDELIRQKYEQINNDNIGKVAYDQQAKIGCKGGNKFWFGYKKHVSLDMQSGLINKVAVTPANLTDAQGFRHVCPDGGAVYADKGYCKNPAKIAAKRKNVHLCAIKNNNMKDKNRDLDRWISSVRSPGESVFSKQRRRVKYCGIAKNQFAEFMNAICFNLRRVLVLEAQMQDNCA